MSDCWLEVSKPKQKEDPATGQIDQGYLLFSSENAAFVSQMPVALHASLYPSQN
jgi:hypothetical protein